MMLGLHHGITTCSEVHCDRIFILQRAVIPKVFGLMVRIRTRCVFTSLPGAVCLFPQIHSSTIFFCVVSCIPPLCFQVYLAGIKTCLFPCKTCALPSVLLCLLDFEPLVFEGLRKEEGGPSQETNSKNNGDGQDDRPPTLLSCNKGKSCFFKADTERLFRALRLPGALTLMVVSKLSKRQVHMSERKQDFFTMSQRTVALHVCRSSYTPLFLMRLSALIDGRIRTVACTYKDQCDDEKQHCLLYQQCPSL